MNKSKIIKDILTAKSEYYNAKNKLFEAQEKLFELLLDQEDLESGILEEPLQTQQITQSEQQTPNKNLTDVVSSSKPQIPELEKPKEPGYKINPEFVCPDCGGTNLKAPFFKKNIICKGCGRDAPRNSMIWKDNKVRTK